MNRKAILVSFTLSGPLLASPAPLASQQPGLFQELGVFAISGHSDHRELPDPTGFGAAATWELTGRLMARLSYHRFSQDTRKEGVVCDQYSQRINCRSEMTETNSDFSGLRGALMLRHLLGQRVRLGAGGGLSFNHLSTESVGTVSGLDADLLAPNAGIIGFTALASVAWIPLAALPVRITGGLGVHWVNFKTCSATEPPQYDPYCGMAPFREVEVGLSYAF